MALKLQAIELAIITAVADTGDMTPDEISEHVKALEGYEEVTDRQITQMLAKLDRAGTITRQNQMAGYQITANGTSALQGLRQKAEARYIAPYANWGRMDATVTLISPSLGPITEPGNQGIAHFPRFGQIINASGEVESAGQVMVYGGWILAAMKKASDKCDATVTVDAAGQRRTLPDVAWSHVSVKPVIFPSDQRLTQSIRRPTNLRGQSVGEIVHESLPAGTTFRISAHFPLSHFSALYIVSLLSQVEDVGISAAGTGKGGIWGLCQFSSVLINGEEIWPTAKAAQKAPTITQNGHNGSSAMHTPSVDTGAVVSHGEASVAVGRIVSGVRTVIGAR